MRPIPQLFAVGGAHIDRRGQVTGDYVPAASNPGSMREDVGGGAFNALRTAVRRGVDGALLSIRGGDTAGETVARAIVQAGIADRSVVFLDRATPSYTAILDRDGELVTGFADMGLYDLAFAKQMRRAGVRQAVVGTDAVLCDANLPEAALERLAAIAAGKPIFAIAISVAKATRLRPVLDQLALLFMNRREMAALTGLDLAASEAGIVTALRGLGLSGGVVTGGPRAVLGFADAGAGRLTPPAPRSWHSICSGAPRSAAASSPLLIVAAT